MTKNPFEYGYKGDETFEISAQEYNLLRTAVEQGIEATQRVEFPEVFEYVDVKTSKKVTKYSDEDLALGKVAQITDKEATFSAKNAKVSYDTTKIKIEMLHAQQLLMDIHIRNVESGVAKSVEELQPSSNAKN